MSLINTVRCFGVTLAWIAGFAVALSLFFGVAYIYTLIGLSAWAFVGHFVTVDDDLPGGWSNPDGKFPVPWKQLVVKGIVLVALGIVAFSFPGLRNLGAAP